MRTPDIVDIKVAVKKKKILCYVKDNCIYMKNGIGECVRICEIEGVTVKDIPCHIGGHVYLILIDMVVRDPVIVKAVVKEINIGSFADKKNRDREMYKISVVAENGQKYEYYGSSFGRSVFTTSEAAEEALKTSWKAPFDERPEMGDNV